MARKKTYNDLSSVLKELPNYLSQSTIYTTDTFILDYLLGGGLETGGFIQLLGDSGCGKSTIALSAATSICSKGLKVVYVDTESSITTEQLEATGAAPYVGNSLFVIRESTFDKVEEVLDKFIATGEICLFVIDSLASLVNSCFTNLNDGISITTNSSLYGSRPLTNFMNKYKSLASSENFCLLFTNQWRQRISTTGSVDKAYGGKNTLYNSDVIIKISKMNTTGPNKEFYSLFNSLDSGMKLDLEIIKSNKRKPNIYPCYFYYGKGISNLCSFIYALVKRNAIRKNGSYFEFSDEAVSIKENGINNFINRIKLMNVDLYRYNDLIIKSFYDELDLNK